MWLDSIDDFELTDTWYAEEREDLRSPNRRKSIPFNRSGSKFNARIYDHKRRQRLWYTWTVSYYIPDIYSDALVTGIEVDGHSTCQIVQDFYEEDQVIFVMLSQEREPSTNYYDNSKVLEMPITSKGSKIKCQIYWCRKSKIKNFEGIFNP